jgi:hypothetical protein
MDNIVSVVKIVKIAENVKLVKIVQKIFVDKTTKHKIKKNSKENFTCKNCVTPLD